MKYEEPTMEIIYLENEVITTSGTDDPNSNESYGLLF